MEPIRISEKTSYVATCPGCGRSVSETVRSETAAWADAHKKEHDESESLGAKIGGMVFSTENHPTWLGTYDAAEKMAREGGFAYLEFNGRIYMTGSGGRRFGWAKDVPGLSK